MRARVREPLGVGGGEVHGCGVSRARAARALGRRVRTLFQLQYHLLMSHALPQLKLVCPLDVMTEWEEMLWGTLRRWSVQMCNKARGSMCVNAIVRTYFRSQVQESYGVREEFSGAAYRGTGPLPTAYRESGFERDDEEDLVLGPEYLEHNNFPAYRRQIAPYLAVHTWHTVGGDASAPTLTIHCGDKALNYAEPAPLECSTHSLADVRRLDAEAEKAYSASDLSEHERATMLGTGASAEVIACGLQPAACSCRPLPAAYTLLPTTCSLPPAACSLPPATCSLRPERGLARIAAPV